MSLIKIIGKTPFPATAAADAVFSVIHLANTFCTARQQVLTHAHAAARTVKETELMCAYLLGFGTEMTDEALNRCLGKFLDFTERHLG